MSSRNTLVYFWGSSHAMPHRHFPAKFRPLFDTSTRYYIPHVKGASGRKLTERVVDLINQRASIRAPVRQVIVVNLSDNNLRHNQEAPEDLRCRVANILDHCDQIPDCWVVFTSLIPSIGMYEETKLIFKGTFLSFCLVVRELLKVKSPKVFSTD